MFFIQEGKENVSTNVIIVGEITYVLRAQGNPYATGLVLDASDSSPIISGIFHKVPQGQVGVLDISTYRDRVSRFVESGAYPGDMYPYNVFGAASLDAIFFPYTTATNTGIAGPYLPNWTEPQTEENINAKTLNPFDPFNLLGQMPASGETVSDSKWFKHGHNIAMAASYHPSSEINENVIDQVFERDYFARHTTPTENIRSVGFRAPMILTGWGYDVDGNPVPASGDQPHPEAGWNPKLWKSGPVDLRWDESRGVWTGGNMTKIYLVKITNVYTPPSFSFEVDRSNTRDQYSLNAPTIKQTYQKDSPIYDPEHVAYDANPDNQTYAEYEQLDYTNVEFPFYEAFIIRETKEDPCVDQSYYNIWTEDCQDCGHIKNECESGVFPRHESSGNLIKGKKILIENPLRQSFDAGDLAFTVYTGRKKEVNTGKYIGGTGSGAAINIETDSSGNAYVNVLSSGSGYTYGGFAVIDYGCKIYGSATLYFESGVLQSGTFDPPSGHPINTICSATVYPNDAVLETELLPIHWVIQAEFKPQQIVTYVECDNGVLQTCSMKIQTQGFKTCEWCGEDTALINA